MAIFLRLLVFVALWLFSRRAMSRSEAKGRIDKLAWAGRIQLIWRLVRDGRVPVWARAVAFLPVLYLLSPIDLLPDFIPVLGRMDDALIFGFVVELMVRAVPAAVLQEHLDGVSLGLRRS